MFDYILFRKDHPPGLEEMQASSCILRHFLQYWEISGSWAEGSIHGGKGNDECSHIFCVWTNYNNYLCNNYYKHYFQDAESLGQEISDWERYAAEEYDILVAEEAANEYNDG